MCVGIKFLFCRPALDEFNCSNGGVKKEAWHVGSDRGTPTARTSGTTSRLVRSKRSLLSSLEATFNGLTCGLWSHRTSKH